MQPATGMEAETSRREATRSVNSRRNQTGGPAPHGKSTAHRRVIASRNGGPLIPSDEPTSPPAGELPRSQLSNEELEHYRQLLLAKRRELLGDVNHMADEALGNSRSEAGDESSRMPLHLADVGTDQYEREFTLGLMKTERQTLEEIDEALARIQAGTYGICLGTHKMIAKARLAAKPWAKYSIAYSRLVESRSGRTR